MSCYPKLGLSGSNVKPRKYERFIPKTEATDKYHERHENLPDSDFRVFRVFPSSGKAAFDKLLGSKSSLDVNLGFVNGLVATWH